MISFTLARILLFAVVIVCLISAPKKWRQDAKIMASGGATNEFFGLSTAIAGDVALVGATGVNGNRGAAYIFRSSDGGATWPSTETQKLTASDGASNDNFGLSSAIAGDVFVVGAPRINSVTGGAYIFRSSNGGVTWPSTETQKLTASDGFAKDSFGWSTAISGDVILVGANGFNSSQGAVYIFRSSDGGVTWPANYTQKLTASDGVAKDKFGSATAISGDVILVGADGVNSEQGAAYIFRSSDGGVTWPSNYTQKLTASVGATNDEFGSATAISGDVALVGATEADGGKGAGYIFRSSDGGVTWPSSETQKLTASDGAAGNYFGGRIAISGDVALVGAEGVNSYQGAAYIFEYRTAPSSSSSDNVASDDIGACASS
jgi:hypothetical protein